MRGSLPQLKGLRQGGSDAGTSDGDFLTSVMELVLELQLATSSPDIPQKRQFRHWVEAVLSGRRQSAELVIRVVDKKRGVA